MCPSPIVLPLGVRFRMMTPIVDVARGLGIAPELLEPYGRDKAKVRLEALDRPDRAPGKLILVSAITPTPAGEGKTTTSIGLAQGLRLIGERAVLALRQPSTATWFCSMPPRRLCSCSFRARDDAAARFARPTS